MEDFTYSPVLSLSRTRIVFPALWHAGHTTTRLLRPRRSSSQTFVSGMFVSHDIFLDGEVLDDEVKFVDGQVVTSHGAAERPNLA